MPATEPMGDEAARKAVLKRLRSHKTAVTDLPDAVREAKRLGIEITTIAETAGIARTRVYRIIADGHESTARYVRSAGLVPAISAATEDPHGCTDACCPDPYAPTRWVEENRARRAHEAHMDARTAKPDTEETQP